MPPGRPPTRTNKRFLGAPTPRHAPPFATRPKSRGVREARAVWACRGLAPNISWSYPAYASHLGGRRRGAPQPGPTSAFGGRPRPGTPRPLASTPSLEVCVRRARFGRPWAAHRIFLGRTRPTRATWVAAAGAPPQPDRQAFLGGKERRGQGARTARQDIQVRGSICAHHSHSSPPNPTRARSCMRATTSPLSHLSPHTSAHNSPHTSCI